MREIFSVVAINIAIFLALILIHEASHAIAGIYTGCYKVNIVLFDLASLPHTDLVCPMEGVNLLVHMSGLITTSLFGLIFLLTRNSKSLVFLAVGFSLIFGALDMSILFSSEIPFYISNAVGFGFIISGECFLASSQLAQKDFSLSI